MTPINWYDAWTGPDKVLHFAVGFGIAVAGAAIASLAKAHLPPELPVPAAGLALSALAAVGKEAWDMFHPPHSPSFQDAAVTTIGGALAALLVGVIIA